MSTSEALQHIGDLLSARRVYAEPIERDGIVVIPAAQFGGGGGSERIDGQKDGGGMGLRARPIGAFEIRDGKTTWKPAIDWNRVILRTQLIGTVCVCAFLVKDRLRGRSEASRSRS
jgi:hypothetical protein